MASFRCCLRQCVAFIFWFVTAVWIVLSCAILFGALILLLRTCDREKAEDVTVLVGNDTGDSELLYNTTALDDNVTAFSTTPMTFDDGVTATNTASTFDDGAKTTEHYRAATTALDPTTQAGQDTTTAWLELIHTSDTTQETATSAWPELNSTGAATPEPDSDDGDDDDDDELTIKVCDIRVLGSVLLVLGYPTLALMVLLITLNTKCGKCVAKYGARYPDSTSNDNTSSDD